MPSLRSKLASVTLVMGALINAPLALAEKPTEPYSIITNEAITQLEADLSAYVTDQKLGNVSYEVWQNGTRVGAGFFGKVSADQSTPVTDQTIHRIYSMTKPVTAVGLLLLMERGHFSLDDPITKFLPEFEDTEVLADSDAEGNLYTYSILRPPTMGQLLSHTAGFAYGVDQDSVLDRILFETSPMQSESVDALVEKVASIPYRAQPGAEWNYSISSDLQGAIIERITGESLDVFLEREVFQPLGMVDTGFYLRPDQMNRASAVTMLSDHGLIEVKDAPLSQEEQSQIFFEGGQGLFSTHRDYAKFASFLLNSGRVANTPMLSEETVQQLHTNAIRFRGEPSRQGPSGYSAGMGYGFGVGTIEDPELAGVYAPKGSFYWHGALGSWFWVDPENDIVFVGMTQSRSVLGFDLMRTSMNALYPAPVQEDADAEEIESASVE